MKQTWSVLVVYEGAKGRERAVRFCDSLVAKYWSRCGFDIAWCKMEEMGGAVSRAAESDLVVFSIEPNGEVPFEFVESVESWLRARGEREGMLIGIMDPEGSTPRQNSRYGYLREIAHRAGMDYLTHEPENLERPIPDSLDSFSARAVKITSVLDEILHRHRVPTTTPGA